ncbi:MAG: hypothetical protein KDD00_17600, partial [Ignavibacteriae bacterium]|nr:hypothetical protein [Ignavibacteriota bacterium]
FVNDISSLGKEHIKKAGIGRPALESYYNLLIIPDLFVHCILTVGFLKDNPGKDFPIMLF